MKKVLMLIETIEPVIISDGTFEGMAHKTLGYIPGSMLLGAFAASWVRKNRGVDAGDHPEFKALFLRDSVRYGNGYPCDARGVAAIPLPNCLKYIKGKKSLPELGDDRTKKPVVMNSLAFVGTPFTAEKEKAEELAGQRALSAENLRLKKVKPGFFTPDLYRSVKVPVQWNMHVSIDPVQKRAEEGKLFGYQAVSRGVCFQAEISFDDDGDYESFMDLAKETPELCFGHSRSAGYGRCRVSFTEQAPVAVKKVSAASNIYKIMLLGDYVPSTSWHEPVENFYRELESFTGQNITPEKNRNFCTMTQIRGFNSHWRLPRTTRNGISKGSVISFSTPEPIENAVLLRLEQQGLGTGRRDGYGTILVNPAFLADEDLVSLDNQIEEQAGPVREIDAPASSPQLSLIRRRSLTRQADEHVTAFLASEEIGAFVTSFLSQNSLANNQLGNMRMLLDSVPQDQWHTRFSEIKNKKAGEGWQKCHIKNFYRVAGLYGNESLFSVMEKLVEFELFKKFWTERKTVPVLPGGSLSSDETELYQATVHKSLLVKLIELLKVTRRVKEKK